MLLGDQYRDFHKALQNEAASRKNLRVYYVTAWEMARMVKQAEQGQRVQDFSHVAAAELAGV